MMERSVLGRHFLFIFSARQYQVKVAVVIEEEERNQSFSNGSYLGLAGKTILEGFRRD